MYDVLNDMIYERWGKDDCEDIDVEILSYLVLDNTMRWILGMEDGKITKQAIIDIAKHYLNDPEILADAKALSEAMYE